MSSDCVRNQSEAAIGVKCWAVGHEMRDEIMDSIKQ